MYDKLIAVLFFSSLAVMHVHFCYCSVSLSDFCLQTVFYIRVNIILNIIFAEFPLRTI